MVVAAVVGGGLYYQLWSREAAARQSALLLAAAGDFAAAEPDLLRALGRNPDDPVVVESLARGYLKADDLRAEEFLNRWVKLRPGLPEPLQARMQFYRHRRDGKAVEDARQLLQLDPTNTQLRRTAMNQAFSFGSFEEAESLCRECLKDQPSDRFLRTMLAEIRRVRGDAAGAGQILDALIAEAPSETGPRLARAKLHQEAGEWEQSIPLLRPVFERDALQRRGAGYLLGLALDRTGRADEAGKVWAEVRRLQDVEVFGNAIKNQPDNLELPTRLGAALLANGHADDGLRMLASVLSRDPTFRPAHMAMAAHLEKQGDAARAAEHRRLAGQ